MRSRSRGARSRVATTALLLTMVAGLMSVATPAQAAVFFNVKPISWDVIGLDSNNINVGPNTYEVGARTCNTGDTIATTVKATFVWETYGAFDTGLGTGVNPTGWPTPPEASNYVRIQPGTDSTQVIHDLAVNECFDFYFNLEVLRDVDSYFWTRPYHIIVQNCPSDVCNADPTLDYNVSTPTNRQIYIEKILSQNRNYVASTGNGGACPDCGLYLTAGFTDSDGPGGTVDPTGTRVSPAPATNLLKVGQQYNFTLVASTATGGYGSWSSQINWPRGIFQILQVKTQLQQFPQPVNPTGCCFEDSDPYTWTNPVPPATVPAPSTCSPGVGAAPGTFGCNGVIAQTWADAGAFCEVVPTGGNTGCTSPATVFATSGNDVAYRGLDPAAGNEDTAGNMVYISFKLQVVKVGGASTSAVVWDGSGSSYHYNSDYNSAGNFYSFCASNSGTSSNCDADTAVSFDRARAARTSDGGRVLRWTTGSETDNLGFNVYAQRDHRKVKLNGQPVAGSALSDGDSSLAAANTYEWVDTRTRADAYWIEALDLDGSSQWRGPVKVRGWAAATPRTSSPRLSDLSPLEAPRSGGAVARNSALGTPVISEAPASVARGGVEIDVDHEGWYRIPLRTLKANGVKVTDTARLHLYAEGVEQPIRIRHRAVEFYGLGVDTPQTDTRVYWLWAGATGGRRVRQLPSTGGIAAPASYEAVAERRDKGLYFSSLANGDDSNFFGSVVGADEVPQTLTVKNPSDGEGTLDVALQGVTAGEHSVSVSLNGSPVGVVGSKDRERGSISVPVNNIVEGTNTVTLSSPSWSDLSVVESARITYNHAYRADSDAFGFSAPGGSTFSVSGFSGARVRMVDVTDPAAPVELSVATTPDGSGGYAASATAPGAGSRALYAFVSGSTPASVEPTVPSRSLARSPETDMLIISGPDLTSSVAPLAMLHASQNLRTRIIPITRVYDQFSYGQESPQALKDFLDYAQTNWASPPRYVMFAGDASLDPRGYLGPKGAAADVVPTKQVDTHAGEVSSDAWFADVDGDLRPEVALGRLPARTTAEAEAMVSKIVAYSTSSGNRDTLVAAGAPHAQDSFDFSAAAHEAANMTPPGSVGTVVSSAGANAKESLISAMNEGPSVVGYYGHGSVSLWGGGFFGSSDVSSLTNTEHPFFFTPMTCYNGYFSDPNLDSLSEALLKADGGAVAAYASSGATEPVPQRKLAQGLYRYLEASPSPVIGDAVVAAAAQAPTGSLSEREVLVTWTLLGDPAMRLR